MKYLVKVKFIFSFEIVILKRRLQGTNGFWIVMRSSIVNWLNHAMEHQKYKSEFDQLKFRVVHGRLRVLGLLILPSLYILEMVLVLPTGQTGPGQTYLPT